MPTPVEPAADLLATLERATVFALGAEGFAAVISPELAAYRKLAPRVRELGDALRALVTSASPAGRIYAALLLGELDPAAGRAAWTQLQASRDGLMFHPGGCHVRISAVLGEIAADALEVGIDEAVVRATQRWRAIHVPPPR